jgi:hypothetical protein
VIALAWVKLGKGGRRSRSPARVMCEGRRQAWGSARTACDVYYRPLGAPRRCCKSCGALTSPIAFCLRHVLQHISTLCNNNCKRTMPPGLIKNMPSEGHSSDLSRRLLVRHPAKHGLASLASESSLHQSNSPCVGRAKAPYPDDTLRFLRFAHQANYHRFASQSASRITENVGPTSFVSLAQRLQWNLGQLFLRTCS